VTRDPNSVSVKFVNAGLYFICVAHWLKAVTATVV